MRPCNVFRQRCGGLPAADCPLCCLNASHCFKGEQRSEGQRGRRGRERQGEEGGREEEDERGRTKEQVKVMR